MMRLLRLLCLCPSTSLAEIVLAPLTETLNVKGRAACLETGSGSQFGRVTVLKVFLALAVLSFLLRIFYSTHLYQDDGLWFTTAEEILRGKTLYREIYFDKPPALALVYAGLFKIFGAHIITIRLFTILYSLMISAVLYLFGSWLYDRRAGLVAATMFTVFSTTYMAGHVQGLNTDFLMALPYAAGAYLLTRARAELFHKKCTRSASYAFTGSALVGIAFQVNPKAIFDLIFFALFLSIARRLQARDSSMRRRGDASLFAIAIAGFVAGAIPFLIHIAATGALAAYRSYVWDWGARYAGYYPLRWIAAAAFEQTADYFLLNSTLLIALIFVAVSVQMRVKDFKREDTKLAPAANLEARAIFIADSTLLLWLAVSYAGMAIGGRFFGHYFFQIIPCLCLIGARGVIGIFSPLISGDNVSRARRVIFVLLIIGFIFTLVRFHGRTVMLAADWMRGVKSADTAEWLHERLNHEERRVAAQVRGLGDSPEAADTMGTEEMRIASPRVNGAEGPSDYLFVWGYRPEIYYWSGLLPASKYLSTQPLTGVPADVHYFGDEYHSVFEDGVMAAERAELVRELEQVRPEYIIDELGTFNSNLSINSFRELREFMEGYKSLGMIERFAIYRRKDFTKGYRLRNPDAQH